MGDILKLDPFLATIEDDNGAETEVIATAVTHEPFKFLVLFEDGAYKWIEPIRERFGVNNADLVFKFMREAEAELIRSVLK